MRALYRYFLKEIPKHFERKLEREARISEFRYLFREAGTETDIEEINETKMLFYGVIAKIEAGIYPPFPFFNRL